MEFSFIVLTIGKKVKEVPALLPKRIHASARALSAALTKPRG